ncbi:class I SAM-dependent methyltransferase [Pendulispora albinea]|uniref:Methyltransferase domain-containing protein n=1 Tax=Pendulispora albinea TaxID=2741071 RepID=A0ABZ2M8Z7_9BACT
MASVDFEAIRQKWDASAEGEERWSQSPSVNRELRWRLLEPHLQNVRTILDVGGATGAFSIPLARRGFDVTHVDLSPAMLALARRKAEGLANIRFVEGNAIDLGAFADRSFDVVLNMDGPISASGPHAEDVLRETCRVAKRTVMVSAAHRAWVDVSARRDGKKRDGLRAFTAAELRTRLEENGFFVHRAAGIGTLAHLCGDAYVDALFEAADPDAIAAFLNACEAFDRDLAPDGPGTNDDTGLVAVAARLAP